MGNIKTKTWDAPREADDGFRLLICRYRPRALPKKKETWHLWRPEFGPSKELHAAFYGKHGQLPINWETYKSRYLAEMKEQEEGIAFLAEKVASGLTLTLLCSSACTDGLHCHRFLLKELIEAKLADRPPLEPQA
jgi:uncharacterized protein YeaO (DUF488 family)